MHILISQKTQITLENDQELSLYHREASEHKEILIVYDTM